MKRIVRILLITLVVLSSCSITTSHLEFKGIPIDGDVISFSKKLEKKGFEVKDSFTDEDVNKLATYKRIAEYNEVHYDGEFFNGQITPRAELIVDYTDISHTPYRITAALYSSIVGFEDDIFDGFRNFIHYIETFNKKYGKPTLRKFTREDVRFISDIEFNEGKGHKITMEDLSSLEKTAIKYTNDGLSSYEEKKYEDKASGIYSATYNVNNNKIRVLLCVEGDALELEPTIAFYYLDWANFIKYQKEERQQSENNDTNLIDEI